MAKSKPISRASVKLISATPAIILSTGALTTLVTEIFRPFGGNRDLSSTIVQVLFAAVLAVALPIALRHCTPAALGLAFLTAGAFLVGIIRAEQLAAFQAQIGIGLGLALACMVICTAPIDFKLAGVFLYIGAVVILVAAIVQLFLTPSEAQVAVGYSQNLAYQTLPATVILLDAAFRRRHLLNGLLALLSAGLLLSAGARGPLVALFLFLIARTLVQWRLIRDIDRLSASVRALTLLLIAVAILKQDQLLDRMQSSMERLGLSTRLFTLLFEDRLLRDQTRTTLATETWEIISANPVFGVGMTNERAMLAHARGEGPEEAVGWYPHNIALEMWVQHGLLLGSLLLLGIVFLILRALFSKASTERFLVILTFIAVGLFPLFFSGSYLSWPIFFGMIGLLLSQESGSPGARTRGPLKRDLT